MLALREEGKLQSYDGIRWDESVLMEIYCDTMDAMGGGW